MRKPLVVGNWKLNPSRAAAAELAREIAATSGGRDTVDVGIAPPFVHLVEVSAALAGSGIRLGAQDASEFDAGAFTGEVSAGMLAEYGCTFVIVGHSERRQLFEESAERVAAKAGAVLAAGLTPLLCVGEMLAERRAGRTLEVVRAQLAPVLAETPPTLVARAVVAYEPVWAIGTGETASPEQAQEVHAAIRAELIARGVAGEAVRILYGGSVKPGNAAELFAQPDVDGGLIGGASLAAADFAAIVDAAAAAEGSDAAAEGAAR